MFDIIKEKKKNKSSSISWYDWNNERPREWILLPKLTEMQEEIDILIAVYESMPNPVAFTIQWAYTVDWGDGNIENFNSGVKAEHLYDFSNINLNSETLTSFWYKQTIIKVTPQVWNNFTNINFDVIHSQITWVQKSSCFIDIIISAPNATVLMFSSSWTSTPANTTHSLLRHINIVKAIMTTWCYYWLIWCWNLEFCEINLTNINRDTRYLFYKLINLKKVNWYIKSSNCWFMFTLCSFLEDLSELNFDVSSVTGIVTNVFNWCVSLKKLPIQLHFWNLTSISSMFYGCNNLTDSEYEKVNIWWSSNITDIGSLFFNNYKITKIPKFFYDNSLRFTWLSGESVFQNCINLTNIENLNLSNRSNLNNYFSGCYNLRRVLNLTVGTTSVLNLFNLSRNLCRLTCNIWISFNINSSMMSDTALNELFTSLPTVTSATLTITGNYWAATCDTSIATAKWRTITT